MEESRIASMMNELADKMHYPSSNHDNLKYAMYAVKMNTSKRELTNEKLALFGDKILDLVVIEYYFKETQSIRELDDVRQNLTSNERQHAVLKNTHIIDYAFNDYYFHLDKQEDDKKVPDKEHSPYLEAIVGAMYFDAGFDKTRDWIISYLIPKLISKLETK